MTRHKTTKLDTIHNRLMKLSQAWALRQGFNADLARELRGEAILLNHASYLETIPAYAKVAREEGCDGAIDVRTIKRKLMVPADIFKSYCQEWLDAKDFSRMNGWLSNLYCERIDTDACDIHSIDDWITSLRRDGIEVSYSSGTSGAFSFVPRSSAGMALARTANTSYLSPLMTRFKTGTPLTRALLPTATRLLSADSFARLVNRAGLRDYDGLFLGFRHGGMGNQRLMQEMARFSAGVTSCTTWI